MSFATFLASVAFFGANKIAHHYNNRRLQSSTEPYCYIEDGYLYGFFSNQEDRCIHYITNYYVAFNITYDEDGNGFVKIPYDSSDTRTVGMEVYDAARMFEGNVLTSITPNPQVDLFTDVNGYLDAYCCPPISYKYYIECEDRTKAPTSNPTTAPTASPTTPAPTGSPTASPTTAAPTGSPTASPTTAAPTGSPTASPTTPEEPCDCEINEHKRFKSTWAQKIHIEYLHGTPEENKQECCDLCNANELCKSWMYKEFSHADKCILYNSDQKQTRYDNTNAAIGYKKCETSQDEEPEHPQGSSSSESSSSSSESSSESKSRSKSRSKSSSSDSSEH